MAETMRVRVPMRGTGADQLVRAMKAGNAAGAKGLDQAVELRINCHVTGGVCEENKTHQHAGVLV